MNGKAHFTANAVIFFGAFGVVASQRPELLWPAMTGSTLGLLITPDYDFKQIYIKSIIGKLPVLGALWNTYWWPYAVLFKHRKLSHNIVFGTLTRFIYLLLPVYILYILYIYPRITISIENILIVYALWYIQDLSHYILDSRFLSKKND